MIAGMTAVVAKALAKEEAASDAASMHRAVAVVHQEGGLLLQAMANPQAKRSLAHPWRAMVAQNGTRGLRG